MTPHNHSVYVEGCYRCELSKDEARSICLENWPEAESGAFDPRCCRFPKSCSIPSGATGVERSTSDDEAPNPAPEVTQEEEA